MPLDTRFEQFIDDITDLKPLRVWEAACAKGAVTSDVLVG